MLIMNEHAMFDGSKQYLNVHQTSARGINIEIISMEEKEEEKEKNFDYHPQNYRKQICTLYILEKKFFFIYMSGECAGK
jgi:hypothetical protein